MRGLLLVLALAGVGDNPGRFARFTSRGEPGRTDRGIDDPGYAFFEFAPASGAGMGTACACTAVTGAKGEAVTTVRASVAECMSTDSQKLTQCPANVTRVMSGRIDDPVLGVLADEEGRQNDAVQSRDLSQAVWTRTNVTCTHTATGMRADVNGATTCTATAPNGTVCQTVTRAATAASFSAFLKRRTGSGAISLARDGATYTDVSASLSSSIWRRAASTDIVGTQGGNTIVVAGLTASTLNPQLCFKFATSGDAVDIDFVQEEVGNYSTMPIETVAAAAARTTEITDVTVNTLATVFTRYSFAGTAIVSAPIALLPASPIFAGVWGQVVTPGVSNPTVYTDSYALGTRSYNADDSQSVPTPYVTGQFVPVTPGIVRVSTYFDGSVLNGCVSGVCGVGAVVTWTPANRNIVRLGGYNATNNNFGGVRKKVCLDPSPTRCL